MEESKRKLGRKAYGPYRLVSIKDPGCPWSGTIWVKVKSLEEFDKLSESEIDKVYIQRCPFLPPEIMRMCFPTDYPYVRSECKSIPSEHELCGDSSNCVFLFRYANSASYNCRLRLKVDKERVYE